VKATSFGCALVLTGLTVAIGLAQTNESVSVARILEPIQLDGELDEAVWQSAAVLKLAQQSPHPGVATPFTAEVRIVLAGDRLYFGITCHDPEPRKIAIRSLQRDDPMSHRIDHMLSGTLANVAVKIFGDDLHELRRLARQAQTVMSGVPGVVDLSSEQQQRSRP
jgi:hypothetical protein